MLTRSAGSRSPSDSSPENSLRNLHNVPYQKLEPKEYSFVTVFKTISALALAMGGSFTLSIEIFLFAVLFTINSSNETDTAAIADIVTLENVVLGSVLSTLISVVILGSGLVGEYRNAGISQQHKDDVTIPEISTLFGNGLRMAAMVSPLAIIPFCFSESLLTTFFQQDSNVASTVQKLTRIHAIAIPGMLFRQLVEQLIFMFGHKMAPLILGLTSLGIGSTFAYLLGFGPKDMPKLGPVGIALGFTIETYLTAFVFAAYVMLHPEFKNFHYLKFLKQTKESKRQLGKLFQAAAPVVFSVMTETAMLLGVGLLAGRVGLTEQAAVAVATQLLTFNFVLELGFGFSAQQEVNRLMGAGLYKNASRTGIYGLATTAIWVSVLPLVCAIEPRVLTLAAGNNNPMVSAKLADLMPIIAAGNILDALRFYVLQQLRVLNDSNRATIVSTICLSTGMILSAVLGLKTEWGVYGIAAGYTVGNGLGFSALMARWLPRIQEESIRAMKGDSPASGSPRDRSGSDSVVIAAPPVLNTAALSINATNEQEGDRHDAALVIDVKRLSPPSRGGKQSSLKEAIALNVTHFKGDRRRSKSKSKSKSRSSNSTHTPTSPVVLVTPPSSSPPSTRSKSLTYAS